MKLDDFKKIVETRLNAENGNPTEKSFLLEAYRVAEELKQLKQADDNDVEPKRVATIYDYARILRKFCKNGGDCAADDCPLSHKNNTTEEGCVTFIINHTNKANDIISKYAEEHPTKTYRQDFYEKFPNAKRFKENGYPVFRACAIYDNCDYENCKRIGNKREIVCKQCWDMPMEE